ncbi:MAG TPA: hypothetical protein VLA34_11255, partial [Candidatus Krumholzibacterium sp.]|nr:hypothetical protein [Candidatus Krumholzibacterium sp.]
MITVEAYSIDLDHRGDMIGCRTEMAIENETAVALDRYLFTLNPGLEVVSAECSSGPCSFERDLHHLWIILPGPISPGSKDTVEVVYSGEIEDDACYLFLTDFERWRPVDSNFGRDITSPAGRFAIIDEDNLVLLPEIQWYPLPGVQYDPDRPDRCPAAFHSFELSYSGMKGLVPVSQGRRNDMETGRILFTPSHPMIGISVIAGDYRVRSMAVDGTTYSSYTYKAYDRLDDFLPAPQDTLPAMIRELRDEYDTDAFFPYPYDRFSAVELPAHLRYHANRLWPGTGPWIQPEMMLSGRESRSHEVRLKRQSRHLESGYVGRSEPLTEKEIKARLLRLQMATFGNLAYYGTYNSHRVRLVSDELPTISKAFDVYNQFHGYARGLGYNLARSIDGRDMPDRLDPMTMTSRALRGRSLQELVASQADPDSTYMAVMAKGMCLFKELEARIGEKEFLRTLEALVDAHPFSSITLAGLAGEVDRRFGVDILPFVEEWYSSSDLPCFIFTDIELVQAIVGDHPLYNLRLKVSNPSKRDGAFVLSGADPRESIERPFLV